MADVEAAVEAAALAAEKISGYHSKLVIANTAEGIENFLELSCL